MESGQEGERARKRLFSVAGVAGIVLREMAGHLWFYLALGLIGSAPGIVVNVFFVDRETIALALLAGCIVPVVFGGAVMLRAHRNFAGGRETVRAGAANYFSFFKLSLLGGILGLLVAVIRNRYVEFEWMRMEPQWLRLVFGLVFVGVLIGFLYLEIVFSVVAPAIFFENLTVAQSLKRSMRLAKGERWPIFAVTAACEIAVFMPYIAAALLCAGLQRTVSFRITAIVGMPFWFSFMSVMTAYIYYRLRTAKEQRTEHVVFAA